MTKRSNKKKTTSFDLSKLTDNSKFINAIDAFFKEPSKEKEKNFIEGIKKSNYLVPVRFQGEVKDGLMQKGSQISFVYIRDVNGKKFTPIFTSFEELKKWNDKHEQMVVMPYEEAISTLLNAGFELDGITINPFNQNIVLSDEKIEYIKNYIF